MSFPRCVLHNFLLLILALSLFLSVSKAYAQEILLLNFILNREKMGNFFLIRTADRDIWIRKEDLKNTRLQEGLGSARIFSGTTYISLSSIPDLTFAIDEKNASLLVESPPHHFTAQSLDISYKKPYEVIYSRDNSAFVNYGLRLNSEQPTLDLSTEIGLRFGNYLGTSTFTYIKGDDIDRFIRLQSTLTTDDRKTLQTMTFGDHLTLSGPLGSNLNIAGFNLSKNFSIDPYFIRFPSPSLGGILTTPSEIEVFVNGLSVSRKSITPGNFLIDNIPATVGLGNADIVVKDAYGTERVISKSFYYSDRLLERGIHEYSYSTGFIREDFGEKSFSYGKPVYLSFHNYGFTDRVKAGYALEASEDLMNTGLTASFLVSKIGVLDTALALSSSEGETGSGALLNYSFLSKHINARLALQHLTEGYSNLSLQPEDDKPSFSLGGGIGITMKPFGSVTFDYSKSYMHSGDDISRYALFFNKVVKKNVAFFASGSRIEEGPEALNEIFIGLHVYFDKGISGSISYTDVEGDGVPRASVQKSLPLSKGYGFNLAVEDDRGSTNIASDIRYQNRYGIYGLGYQKNEERENYSLSVTGGIGYIDTSPFFSRPINDGFAKVKVDGLENVRIYHFGNEVGRTDRDGNIIIPVFRSYVDNRISIESQDTPINYAISDLTKHVSPPFRGGSLIRFDVARIQGITGNILIIDRGKALIPESGEIHILFKDRIIPGLIGKNGEFYIENVPPGTRRAKIISMSKECYFDIMMPDSEEIWLHIGKITCEIEE